MTELNSNEIEDITGGCLPIPSPTDEIARRAKEVAQRLLEDLLDLIR